MKAKDYRTTLEPVWCTGCGDFGVLKALTQALSDLEVPVEKLAVISGIGLVLIAIGCAAAVLGLPRRRTS